MKKIAMFSIILILVIGNIVIAEKIDNKNTDYNSYSDKIIYERLPEKGEDIDPFVDLELTVKIDCIRALEEIETDSEPDFFVIVTINGAEFKSPVWNNKRYLYDLNWTITQDVPDEEDLVDVTIELWESNSILNQICDISGHLEGVVNNFSAELTYDLKSGRWDGDDYLIDFKSGYGRLNGCDDGSFYETERDCELWFDIYQNDYDKDKIPYWAEVYAYNTDPEVNNSGEDLDDDGIPIEWEHKWGYNPNLWDNHKKIDIEEDGLDNYEEYLTSQWGSDPYRIDLFVEMDEMEMGPRGQNTKVPEESKEMLRDAYNRRNIVYHLDDGCMGEGGEEFPYKNIVLPFAAWNYYNDYFLHNDPNNWRRGVFHYAAIVRHIVPVNGFAFPGEASTGINCFMLSSKLSEMKILYPNKGHNISFASLIMHETGHNLGIVNGNPEGCDNRRGSLPFQIDYWRYGNYYSCMNYRYVRRMVDYSDGTHGKNDYDDWGNLDFASFQPKED